MSLTKQEIQWLVEGVLSTREDEIGCDDCLSRVGAYAETVLAGLTIPEALRTVEAHLRDCPECREEYEALLLALRDSA
ncbi:hypothetical protein LVJ94_06695 [Pendulispora rubella]|uniref:Zinc-finger domain-containing protein n=1 Tax=Pendulispora rubella TaxID=2741070 RepID=A0ABZ2L7L1_9BACT